MGLTTQGTIFLILCWTIILLLVGFCFSKVLKPAKKTRTTQNGNVV